MSALAPYLSRAYASTHRLSRESLSTVVADLKVAMGDDAQLAGAARSELARLDELAQAMGGEDLNKRCAVSAAHLDFLKKAMG